VQLLLLLLVVASLGDAGLVAVGDLIVTNSQQPAGESGKEAEEAAVVCLVTLVGYG
jgi:hypothetical protein